MNRVLLSRAGFVAAAGLWLAAVFVPPTAHGAGAAIPSHRLADLVASGALPGSTPSWVGVAWYLIPICAALMLMTLGFGGRRGMLLRMSIAGPATISSLAFGAFISKLDISRVGSGLWLGVAGSVCAISATGLEIGLLGKGRGSGVL